MEYSILSMGGCSQPVLSARSILSRHGAPRFSGMPGYIFFGIHAHVCYYLGRLCVCPSVYLASQLGFRAKNVKIAKLKSWI